MAQWVAKSSSEQHFRKSAAITFIVCEFSGALHLAKLHGSYGRQAGRQNSSEFRKF